jgi:tetratricopeptide (TPR) repeat protein
MRIWKEGLTRFPDSALLRIKLALGYVQEIMRQRSGDLRRDAEIAWGLAMEAEAITDKSRLEEWLGNWLMAYLYWIYKGDFARSASEARAAVELVPHDAFSRSDLAQFLIVAGQPDEAMAWLEKAIRQDPNNATFGILGMAQYFAGRPAEAISVFQRQSDPWWIIIAAARARLDQLDEAREAIAKTLEGMPGWTVEKEAKWPSGMNPQFVEPFQSSYLDDLRKAGLPEK